MRTVVLAAALLACTAATVTERAPQPPAGPEFGSRLDKESEGEAVCRDRIHTVREERGLPRLERRATDPEEPLLIAAVDHRIGGCSVLVMKHDTRDVRPIPKPDERAPLLRPAQ